MLDWRHVLAGLIGSPAVLHAGRAERGPVSMRLHHFMSGASPGHREFLQPWAKKVEAESGGQIKIDETFFAGTVVNPASSSISATATATSCGRAATGSRSTKSAGPSNRCVPSTGPVFRSEASWAWAGPPP
jgi:hypothetical protein